MFDQTNGPKSENSRFLLDSKCESCFGGSFHGYNPDRPRLNYSFDPFLCEITKLGSQDHIYNVDVYFVPRKRLRHIKGRVKCSLIA